jgi:hypothetical protein
VKISRKRAPLVLAGAAMAAALVALPATAAADESKATLIPHGYNGPTVDGKFGDWEGIPYLNTEQNSAPDQGLIKAHYNCKTGRLAIAVRGVRMDPPAPDVQATGVQPGGPFVEVERLPSKLPDPDRRYTQGNSNLAQGEGGYEVSFPLASPGAYRLHYSAGRPQSETIAADVPGLVSGYAYVKISCPTLQIEKTATGRYDHIYDWSVQKAATVVAKDSKTPVVKYDINVKKTGPRAINRDVVGTIKVTNHGRIPVPAVRIADHGIGAKDLCRITGVKIDKKEYPFRKGSNYVLLKGILPKSTAYVGYICHPHPDIPPHQLPKKPVNKASVSWGGYSNGDNDNGDNDNGPVAESGAPNGPKNIAYAAAGFQFNTLDDTYKDSVHLFDKNHAGKRHLGKVSQS